MPGHIKVEIHLGALEMNLKFKGKTWRLNWGLSRWIHGSEWKVPGRAWRLRRQEHQGPLTESSCLFQPFSRWLLVEEHHKEKIR